MTFTDQQDPLAVRAEGIAVQHIRPMYLQNSVSSTLSPTEQLHEDADMWRQYAGIFRKHNSVKAEPGPELVYPRYPQCPLDTPNAIRVLNLSAGAQREEVTCHLACHRLENGERPEQQAANNDASLEQYTAISYTWGTMQDHCHILLNGVKWPVTKNLFAVLRRLRYKDRPRKLWIDQLCINQSDNEERSQQVKLMAKIYSFATEVLVWLGDGPDDSYGNHEHDHCGWKLSPNLKDWTMDHNYHAHAPRKQEWHADYLSDVLLRSQHRWWERIWVVQEFVMARRSPRFMYGPFCMLEHELLELPSPRLNLPSHGYDRDAMDQRSAMTALKAAVTELHHRRRDTSASRETHITGMVNIVSTTTSTEPRDKVYGLLSMLSPRVQSMTIVDYNSSVALVYAQATFAATVNSGTFDLMALITRRLSDPHDLPSWTFDFSTSEVPQGLLQIKPDSEPGMPPSAELYQHALQVQYDASSCRLAIAGFLLDTVVDHIRLDYRQEQEAQMGACGGIPPRTDDARAALAAQQEADKARAAEEKRLQWWPRIGLNTTDKVASLSRLRATEEAKSLHNMQTPGDGSGTFRRDWIYYQTSWDITGLQRDPPWYDRCIPRTPLKPESS